MILDSLSLLATRLLLPLTTTDDTGGGTGGGTIDNPFNHTTPSLSVFGVDFSNKLYAILGGVWGAAFVYTAARLIIALVKFASAKKVQHNPDAISDAAGDLKLVAIAIVGLSAVAIIFTALVNLF